MNYVICDAVPPRGVCRLGAIENVPDWAEMQKGQRQRKLPEGACFRMSDNFPKDVKLADVLSNKNDFLVVSERTVELLRSIEALAQNDVHEVAVINHKGRREKARYFVVHQYDFVPCADAKKTVGTKSKVNPVEYVALTKLVLDEKAIPKRVALFRPLEYNSRAFVRRDVADALTAAGTTGVGFFEIDSYDDF